MEFILFSILFHTHATQIAYNISLMNVEQIAYPCKCSILFYHSKRLTLAGEYFAIKKLPSIQACLIDPPREPLSPMISFTVIPDDIANGDTCLHIVSLTDEF